jgi:hypothetical protein
MKFLSASAEMQALIRIGARCSVWLVSFSAGLQVACSAEGPTEDAAEFAEALHCSGEALGQRDFDIVSITSFGSLFNNTDATGTSNGVDWKVCPALLTNCCGASITNSYTGFSSGDFAPPVAQTDAFHIGGSDVMMVFGQPIESIVFYLREDGGTSSFDFGLAPTILSGAANLNIVGNRIFPNTLGGAVRFDNVDSRKMFLSHGDFDGMNVTWYVESTGCGPTRTPICPEDVPPCPCDGPWKNHGEYVSCVGDQLKLLEEADLVTEEERHERHRAAAQSDCGM